jgi:hypothetical protein
MILDHERQKIVGHERVQALLGVWNVGQVEFYARIRLEEEEERETGFKAGVWNSIAKILMMSQKF